MCLASEIQNTNCAVKAVAFTFDAKGSSCNREDNDLRLLGHNVKQALTLGSPSGLILQKLSVFVSFSKNGRQLKFTQLVK